MKNTRNVRCQVSGDRMAYLQRNLRSCHVSTFNSQLSTLNRLRAFTLIELLVVIAVIGVLAALVLPVVGAVKKHQYIYNTQAELSQLELAIERYKSTYGFYPPSNSRTADFPNNWLVNQLYYELTGTTNISQTSTPAYQTLDASLVTPLTGGLGGDVETIFGAGGFMNCSKSGAGEDASSAKSFLTDLRPRQLATTTYKGKSVKMLVASVGGPDATYKPLGVQDLNPWRYNSLNPTNNPGSYELWVQIGVGGKTNLICNWTKQVQVQYINPLP